MGNELNPIAFMFINMFIVFFVLISLWVLMVVIRAIDPTKAKKKSPEPVKPSAAAAAPANTVATSGQDEIVAAITAAIVAMGYSSNQIASIRPAKAKGWTSAARIAAVETF